MSRLPTFVLGLVLLLISLSPVHAQAVTNAPADANPTAAIPAPPAQAPDDVTNKITNLVHDGKYAEAQQLTTGLLLAYPDDQRLIKAKALIEKMLAPAAANPPAISGSQTATPGGSTEPMPLTGMDKVDYNALLALARQAQQTTDLDEQKKLLQRFMDERELFLRKYTEYNALVELAKQVPMTAGPEDKLYRQFSQDRDQIVKKHPEQMRLWQISGAAALSLNEPAEGYRAGQWLLAFGAADSNDSGLQSLLGELKNKGWLDWKQAAAAAASAASLVQAQQVAENFRGIWYGGIMAKDGKTQTEASLTVGCTGADISKNKCSYYYFEADRHGTEFEIGNDGTIIVSSRASYAGCEGNVYGVSHGPLLTDLRWEVRPIGGPSRQIWSNIAPDGKWFVFSCNRPIDKDLAELSGDNKLHYNFMHWSRARNVVHK